MVADESDTNIITISTSGHVTQYPIGLSNIESLAVIPANANFYAVDYGAGDLLGAPPRPSTE